MSENSPYTPPTAAVADAATEFGELSVFSMQGRLGRLRYLAYGFGIAFFGQILLAMMGGMGAALQSEAGSALSLVGIAIVYIAMIVISIMLAVQRLHDMDKTGWLYLLILVPIVNIIFGLYMLFAPGTQSANRYGNPPPPNTAGVVIAAWLLVFVFVGGIVAAISIPAYNDYVQRSQEIQLQQ
jgi:uncharacterized membrane protein YhaH (DUF805 family)